ncbi:MAG: ABC transporter permease [Oscillospiraceae bacterium]|jgi:simple sugar transport system permease protein|nr:ABC transporter permease [Oscillospiraceae bacterium]
MNKFNLKKKLVPFFFALLGGFFVGGLCLICCGYDPINSYLAMLEGIFAKPKYMVQVIVKSAPLILTGLSVALAFKSGLFNIGAEGQYMVGLLVAALMGIKLSLPPVIHFLALFIAAVIAAGVWGAVAGFLKAKFGINEVVISIMLNWIAFYLHKYIFAQPWLLVRNLDASLPIRETARISIFQKFKETAQWKGMIAKNPLFSDIFKTDLNIGIFVALLAVILIHYFLNKTTRGFEFKTMGINHETASFVGMNVKRNTVLSMFIAGAISGAAGAIQITGVSPYRMTNLAGFEGYGNEGIYIALVANCSPIGCLFSGLFFSAIKCGSSLMQIKVGTPREIIKIITGVIIFFIAVPFLHKLILNYLQKKKENKLENTK